MEREKIIKVSAIVIGLILALVLIFFGFRILSGRFGRANVTPADIAIADVTSNSFTVTFNGSSGLEGRMIYGSECTSTSLTLFAPIMEQQGIDGDATYTAEATLLSPATQYFAAVEIAGRRIGEDCLEVTTKSSGDGITTTSVSPTPEPGLTITPTPTVVPTVIPVTEVTDCNVIKGKIGNGYTALDYAQCIKLQGTPTPPSQQGGLEGLLLLTPTPSI